jgi:exosome complex component RRP4
MTSGGGDDTSALQYLVVPGQVIAVTTGESSEDNFLRGHGTYLEQNGSEQRLVASVCGVVQRVNKLISVESTSLTLYEAQVGDLVVGRILQVGPTRWKVQLLASGRAAVLPLTGVHLPGGAQRVRTAQDARDMRNYLAEGDLLSAEVHKVQADGTIMLHTRSFRYGKLENGSLVTVPAALVPRRKNHYTNMLNNTFEVLWGCNGMIWMQRKMPDQMDTAEDTAGPDLAELQEQRRTDHANMPYAAEERRNLARLRNAVECLRLTYALATSESAEEVYRNSLTTHLTPSQMLLPDNVIRLTAFTRNAKN